MPLTDLLTAQLTDPFRIGLVVALMITTLRTQAVTGTLLPVLAGLVFIAVIIPSTMQATAAQPLWQLVTVGFVANAILFAVVYGIWHLIARFRA